MRVVPLVLVFLAALVVDARADRSVDWSQYIEQPGDKPLKVTSGEAPPVVTAAADDAAAAKPSKASKASKAKAKKGKKAKARRAKRTKKSRK